MADLHAHLERLNFNQDQRQPQQQQQQQQQQLYPGGGLSPPAMQVRKQRSQRFTIPTSPPSAMHKPRSPHPVPSLPYQPPPPPVQTQSIASSDAFYSFNRNPPVDDYSQQESNYVTTSSAYSQPQSAYSPASYNSSPASSYARTNGGAGLRGGLPTEWMGRTGPGAGDYKHDRQLQSGYAALVGRPGPEDEVILTAIVIKNIPFHVPKETLLGIMEDLALPPPFAFNYHFDNGQFRGLAFANFRVAADAALTVTALNGFDLQGRKLRTEFKKVLKEGEKERIERDKALKRIRSQQQLTVESSGPPLGTWNRREASAPGGYPGGEDDDYGGQVQGQFSSSFAGRAYVHAPVTPQGYAPSNLVPSYSTSPPSDVGTSISSRMANSPSASSDHSSLPDLDLNDSQALEIYSRVLIFRDDSLRDELSFARSLSATQRRTVHLVAKKLGLEHRSVGENEDRHVVVFKAGAGPPTPIRHSSFSMHRQSSRDSPTSATSSGYLAPPDASPTPSLARGKKSMPDLRSPGAGPRRPNSTIRDGYSSMGRAAVSRPTAQGLFSSFDSPVVPPVPYIYGGGEESPGQGLAVREQGLAVRQPRGPDEQKGFGTGR